MLLLGSVFNRVEAVLALAAALSVQTPFTNRSYRDVDCQTARKDLDSDHGDPFTLLNAYQAWLEIKSSSEAHTSRKWFTSQFIYSFSLLNLSFLFFCAFKDLPGLKFRSRQYHGTRS